MLKKTLKTIYIARAPKHRKRISGERHEKATCEGDMGRRHVETTRGDDMSRRHVKAIC